MIKLLKNRKFVVTFTVIVAVFATLLGVRGSLNRLAGKVNDTFFNDAVIDGQTYPSVNSYLRSRDNSALGLVTLLSGYSDLENEAGALTSAHRMLVNSDSIAAKIAANEELQNACAALVEKARALDLLARDRDAMEVYMATFSGAQTAILGSMYNKMVVSFWDDVSDICRGLKPLLFFTSPQLIG